MNLNILKGMLIILVIIDHNDFSRSLFPEFLRGLSFHVLGFLTIPFLKKSGHIWAGDFGRALFRLYYPFFLVTCSMAAIVMMLTGGPSLEKGASLLLALYSGNADILKLVTHMYLLWYLPSFISIVTIRTAIESASRSGKMVALASLLVAHLFVGTVAAQIQNYLPMGLLPALYAIPLAYFVVFLHRFFLERVTSTIALLVSATGFTLAKLVQMHFHLYNEIGFSAVADYTSPLSLMVNDLEAVSGVLMLFQVSRINFGRFIEACGRYSLQIYLFHAFIALLVVKALSAVPLGGGAIISFMLSLVFTITLSVVFAYFVVENRLLKRLIFPRDLSDLLGQVGKTTDLSAKTPANQSVP